MADVTVQFRMLQHVVSRISRMSIFSHLLCAFQGVKPAHPTKKIDANLRRPEVGPGPRFTRLS